MTDDQRELDEAYVRDLFHRMEADLARYERACREEGHPQFADALLLNFHSWRLLRELQRRASTSSEVARVDEVGSQVVAIVSRLTQQIAPDAAPPVVTH
jgi:hypothetical protein